MSDDFIKYSLKRIISYSFIENSRVIFDFLGELDHQFKISCNCEDISKSFVYTGEGGLNKRNEIITQKKECISELLTKAWDGEDFLYQNPLSHYLRFWEKYFGPKLLYQDESDSSKFEVNLNERIHEMLHLYQTVTYLSCAEPKHDDLPYLYEDVCITAANILGYKMCYIVYHGGNNSPIQLIARSGYLYSTFKEVISNFEDFINKSTDEIYRFNKDGKEVEGNKYDCLWIKWPLSLRQKDSEKKCFYLVFDGRNTDITEENDMEKENDILDKNTIKIRFLRERLMEVLNRDLGTLLALRYDCGYIKSLNAEFDKKTSFPNMLHISDLHISDNDSWSTEGEKCRSICDILNEIKKEHAMELIAVTGDVVDGARSASMVQERYCKAAMFLRKLAESLWKTKDITTDINRLPHDWKRRFMVITGNHDYLTMNELVSINKARQTRFGSPDTNPNTGTMVKFTYFVSFLIEFFDMPVDTLIKNDLNELRIYENLGIKVLMLNTVSKANVFQNNKVGISTNILNTLKSQWDTDDELCRVCLMHHGPGYKIDYVSDSYEPWTLLDKNNKKGGKTFYKHLCEAFQYYSEFVIDYVSTGKFRKYGEFKRAYEFLDSRIRKKLKKQVNGEKNQWIKEYYESSLYSDMYEMSKLDVKNIDYGNEFLHDLIGKFNRLVKSMESDKNTFHENIFNISEKGNVLFLSGHIHNPVPNTWDEPTWNDKKPEKCYSFIADKIESSFTIIYKKENEGYKRKRFIWKKTNEGAKDKFEVEYPIIFPTDSTTIDKLSSK